MDLNNFTKLYYINEVILHKRSYIFINEVILHK